MFLYYLNISDSDKETIHTATADPDAPASLSLSEQVHEARDRRRRRKALHPLKRADKTDNDDENVKVEDTIELTESINTLMQSAAEIIGPESDCNENAVKIVSDLSITNTVKLPTDKDTTVTKTEDLTEGNIGTRMSVPTKIDDVNAERNVTQFRKDDHLRSAIAKASPLLVKLLSAIWKTEPTPPLRHCLAKDINPTSSLNYDSSNNDNQTNLDSSEVLDPREAHDEKLVVETKTAFDCKEKSKVPVSKSLKGQTMKIATASKGALVSKSLENQTLTGKAASVDKEQTPIPKSLEDQTLETASVSEEQAPLTKSLESPTTKLASVIQEKELTHVSKTLKDKVPVKPVSAYSPEIVKLLERKIDNFGPQKNDNTPFINKERQGVFEVFKQPVPNLKVENIKDESEVIVVEADHTENTTVNHETIIPIKTRQTTDSSDLKAKDNSHSKRPRKGTPKKHYLSVQQLLQIQPKVPQTILKPNLRPTILKPNLPSPTLDPRDISKQSKENSEIVNDARWSRKRPLSVTEVSDLKYTKKCKNVVSMQKQNPVVKERNPVGHSGEEILPFNGNIGNDKVRDNSQFIPFVSQGSSIEIVYNNQKNKSIKAQPVRIAPKPTETVKPVTILEESDLMCMNKSKSVISMKKRRPKIKRRNSLDPVGHSEEDLTFPPYVQGRKVNEKDRGNIQFIPPVSRGSSPVEIIYNNDTIKTIISQPPKIAPKPAETVKVLVKPFIIPEVNDLMCIKKSKSVISMKKRRPKIKRRNSLDAVRHTEGDLTPPPYVESGNVNEKDNLQFIPSVSQGSSVGIDLNNDEMKTIISQPAKVALKAAETVKPVATSEVSAVRKVDVEGRSVISRKKQRSKMKEINSLDPVGQSEEDLTPPLCVEESNVNEKDRANLQLNPSVFQGSSVEVVNKNDKSKTITSQPFKTITKVAEKPTSDSKPALIVMEPSAIKSRHNGKKYYARPLFATQQLVQSNAVFHDINSKPSKTHENDKEACKTDVNDQGLKQVILKTVQSYRPIAPKRLDDDK